MLRWLLRPAPPFEPEGAAQGSVHLRFLGTAGFIVKSAGRTIVLDPYLTRAGVRQSVFGRLRPDAALLAREIPSADEVLAGHAHHDHALDAPALCLSTGARLVGSPAVGMIARAAGLPTGQFVEVRGGEAVSCGPLVARPIPSRHGKAVFGRVPLPGDITSPPPWPPRLWHLRHGQVFNWALGGGAASILHIDSADFSRDALPRADVLLLCAVGRQYRRDYTREAVAATGAKVVLPCHWDDFTVPWGVPPRQLPGVDVEGFVEEIRACGARAVVLAPGQSWAC
jgi:L-ascorbate metabolism protein UlaG (beta-lactamase superfamily)